MDWSKMDTFIKRMDRIGITLKLVANYPWMYIDKINGHKVKERFEAEHGFTLAFMPIREGDDIMFTNLRVIFQLIRKYK